MIPRIWRTLQITASVILGLLLFFAVIELTRAYLVLDQLHPVLGGLYVGLLIAGGCALATWYVMTLGSRPRTLRPPRGINPTVARGRALRRYGRFQVQLLRRLARNPRLSPDCRERLGRQSLRVTEALAAGAAAADLPRCILDTEDMVIRPALESLDSQARLEVSRCVRDVMLAVTVSPWRSADLLVVLVRNLRMVMQLSAIYNTRPTVQEQAAILRDVLLVVASVNVLNYGTNLLQNLTTSVPLLGRFADDVAQGVGAGLLTSVAGHAAVERCRSYGRWEQVEAERSIRANLRHFLEDVKRIVVSDLLQRVRKPVEAAIPESERPSNLQDLMRDGITTAIDATAGVMDSLLLRPATAVGRGVADGSLAVGRVVAQGGALTWQGVRSGLRALGRALPNRRPTSGL